MAVTVTLAPAAAPLSAPLLLAQNADNTALDTALEHATYPFGAGNVTVIMTGGVGARTFEIVFASGLGAVNLLRPVLVNANAAATLVVDELTRGGGGKQARQRITQASFTSGSWYIAYPTIAGSKPPEVTVALKWVSDTLRGDTALSRLVGSAIYVDALPKTPAGINVLYQRSSDLDRLTIDGSRVLAEVVVSVRGVGRVLDYEDSTLVAAARRIDELLHEQFNIDVTDGRILACVREQEMMMPESLSTGDTLRHLGGVYRILAQTV